MYVQRMPECAPGKKIYIEADAPPSGGRFAVDLYNNDAQELSKQGHPGVSRGIHINPRFNQHPNMVVRNTHSGGKWGNEETGGGMPISPGKKFTMCVTFQSNRYEMEFNGWHFATYNYRLSLPTVTTMILSEISHVHRIKYV